MAKKLLNQPILAGAVAGVSPVLLQAAPTWSDVRKRINQVAIAAGEWGGLPKPIDGMRLVMEPRHPFKGLDGARFGGGYKEVSYCPEEKPGSWSCVNSWHCRHRRVRVYVFRESDGRSTKSLMGEGAASRLQFWLTTLGVAANEVWDIETEHRANQKLRDLISGHAYRCYSLSGTFLETSRRSGVTYLFRKLRPTIALKGDPPRPLAALCMHPIGYYEDTWAGTMCPTDDVIAHLLHMRADEHRFWKKANHHSIEDPTAGV